MAEIARLTAKRRDKWRLRWREVPDEDYWAAVIRRLAASPFCRGEGNRGWKATVDWLVRLEDIHVRAMEGEFDGGSSPVGASATDDAVGRFMAGGTL